MAANYPDVWPTELPLPGLLPNISVATAHGYGQSLRAASTVSTAWPTASRAIYLPVRLPVALVAVFAWLCNGATVSGNVDIGIYDQAGTKIVSTGSTPQAGTSIGQAIDLTDTPLGPGLFFLALAIDNITATVRNIAMSPADRSKILGGYQQASAFPLPAIANFATSAFTITPFFGISLRTVP